MNSQTRKLSQGFVGVREGAALELGNHIAPFLEGKRHSCKVALVRKFQDLAADIQVERKIRLLTCLVFARKLF